LIFCVSEFSELFWNAFKKVAGMKLNAAQVTVLLLLLELLPRHSERFQFVGAHH
jgi:hypothetical protein